MRESIDCKVCIDTRYFIHAQHDEKRKVNESIHSSGGNKTKKKNEGNIVTFS